MAHYESIMIGGGVIGTSIAYHLARLGQRRVLLLDRGRIGEGTTAQSSCILPTHYTVPENVRLAQAAWRVYEDFAGYLDDPYPELTNDQHWWQKAVFYQIYPRSFLDGNGDGIGDFSGIYQKLDYLQDLGIDAIWLSPHYPSPQFDCGYDISDFTAVGPEYGSLNDFQKFIKEAHIRGIRVSWILCSITHPTITRGS